MSVLITLPAFDLTTRYLSAWNERVVEAAKRNHTEVIELRERQAVREIVHSAISDKDPPILVLNGHGDERRIAGHDNDVLFEHGKDDGLLRSRLVHAFTCSSAAVLGKECGATAFIGYRDLFIFHFYPHRTFTPLKDPLAGPILESAVQAPLELVKNKSAREAFERSQQKYQQWIDELELSGTSHTTEELQNILPWLHWNKGHQTLIEGAARH